MFNWLKKLFSRKTAESDTAVKPVKQTQDENQKQLRTKPCQSCGKPTSYDPAWKHIPNYCADCKAKFREERGETKKSQKKMIRHTCRACGKTFTFPSTVKHWPNYCRECQQKRKEQKTRL